MRGTSRHLPLSLLLALAALLSTLSLSLSLSPPTLLGAEFTGVTGFRLGKSVSLNTEGNVVAIGAPYVFGVGGQTSMYYYDGGVWQQRGVSIPGESSTDQSGTSISLNAAGDIVAIGAPQNDGGGGDAGHVRVFRYSLSISLSGGVWEQVGTDIDSNPQFQSGSAVSLNAAGDILAIGMPFNNGQSWFGFTNTVRIFRYNEAAGDWEAMGGEISPVSAYDEHGYSVSLNAVGDTVAIGSRLNDGNGLNSGNVRVFRYAASSDEWQQLGGDIDGEGASDLAGTSVSINAAGDTVAVGGPRNDGNGTNSGHVRVFGYSETLGTWQQVGGDIDGEVDNDLAGSAVALNALGDVVAFTAPGSFSTRVMQLVTGVWELVGEIETADTWEAVAINGPGDVVAIGAPTTSSGAGLVQVYGVDVALVSNVSGDPHFVGFRGQRFDFDGRSNAVYSLLSTATLQLNALFVADPRWAGRTVIGAVGLRTADDETLHLTCSERRGILAHLNGQEIDPNSPQIFGRSNGVIMLGDRQKSLDVHVEEFGLRIRSHKTRGLGCFLDLEAAYYGSGRTVRDFPEGLLGRTVDATAANPSAADEHQFEISGGDVLGAECPSCRFLS